MDPAVDEERREQAARDSAHIRELTAEVATGTGTGVVVAATAGTVAAGAVVLARPVEKGQT